MTPKISAGLLRCAGYFVCFVAEPVMSASARRRSTQSFGTALAGPADKLSASYEAIALVPRAH